MKRGALVLVLLLATARAEDHAELGFAIDWPTGEGWGAPEDRPDPNARLDRIVRNRALGCALIVAVVAPRGATLEGDAYATDLVRGISTSLPGATVAGERRHEIGGFPALTLDLMAAQDGVTIRMLHLAVVAGGLLYTVTASWTGDSREWAESALRSFRLLEPAASPERASAAARVSYAVGRYLLGPLLLAGLVWRIVLLVRRTGGRRRDSA